MEAIRTVRAAWRHASERNATLLAAGVSFYTFLSLFPALIAGVLGYGLFASPRTVQRQADQLAEALPADAASVITGQLTALTSTGGSSLGVGLFFAIALALYSASGGVANLLKALRLMFVHADQPGFVRAKAEALVLTVAGVVLVLVLIALVAAAPAVLDALDVPSGVRAVVDVGRWALAAAALTVGVAVVFGVATNGIRRRSRLGVGVAVGLWIAASVGFSVYVDNFGSYGKTYGALAGVVVLMLWLWVGLFALLLGASVETVLGSE
ncbi:MAG TPA: YihY/virulence factor BrkB family protein, partial [Aeromicrobium sp.]|nr:YihY/virulence factor BrkB family protein [Aeromicrobium sp.]